MIYGRLPRFSLSTLGRRQAAALGAALRREPVAAVYASPMLRARQTAHLIAAHHGAPVRHSALLHEVRTGIQGASSRLFDQPGWIFYDDPAHGDGETIREIYDRMRRFLDRAAGRHAGETVIAVSHADPIMIAKVGLAGGPLTSEAIRGPEYPEKCSIVRCEWTEAGWSVGYQPPPTG